MMSCRFVQAFRVAKCMTTNSSCMSSRQILHSCCRVTTEIFNAKRDFCSGRNDDSTLQNARDLQICIESADFTETISNLSTQLGLTHNSEFLKQALVHKSYLKEHASTLKKQHKDNDQLAYLGLQTTKRFLGEILMENFPHLTLQELWDLQNGLLEDQALSVAESLQLSQYIALDSDINTSMASTQSLMAIIAAIYTQEGSEKTKQFLHDHFISNLNANGIQDIIKLQHPKYILQNVSQKNRHEPIRTRFLRRRNAKDDSVAYKVGAFREDKCLAVGVASSAELAEKKACQNTLQKIYPELLQDFSFSYEAEDYKPESSINMGLLTPRQRIITIEKEDREFGFNIKGGEKKRLKNQNWLAYNYFSPIFISSLQSDGLAERLGTLRVGDVILSVNDKSLIGVDHGTAVKILKEATGTVMLTVQHSKEVLLTDRIETEYKKMKQRKRMAELTSEVWAEWHQAQADKHPEKYADVLQLKENIASQ